MALLRFLKDAARLRRERIPAYRSADKVLWLSTMPEACPECRSPFLSENCRDADGIWLEVRKRRMPMRPRLPESLTDWLRCPKDLDAPGTDPDSLDEITVLVEKPLEDSDTPVSRNRRQVAKIPETRRLSDCQDVQNAWLEYLGEQWEPWAAAMREWQEVHRVFESIDFMRRRLEEAEERYECVLGVGLVQWRDPGGTNVKRHLLTGPAEIEFDASRGRVRRL